MAAGIARRADDILNDPQLKHRDAFVELDHPVVGKRVYPSPPFKLSGMPPFRSTPAPVFGQHTNEICHELLGMTEEEIDMIFKEYRGSESDGMGLGLMVSDLIVKAHGGRIDIESQVGQGSVFRVILPVSSAPQTVQALG